MKKLNIRVMFLIYLLPFPLSFFLPLPINAEDHFRLVITADMMGAINECDCPGGQPGGLARRKSIFDAVRLDKAKTVFIDCGTLLKDDMSTAEINLTFDLLDLLSYDLISYTDHDYKFITKTTDFQSSTLKGNLSKQRSSFLDGNIYITALSGDNSVAKGWESTVSQTGISVIALNEDVAGKFQILPDEIEQSSFPLDIIIFYGSGYIEAGVEPYQLKGSSGDGSTISKEILIARAGIYGEYVLVIDIWTEDGDEVSRYEWEAMPTEAYPPDSTFHAKINYIYEGKLDSRSKK